MRDQVEVEAKLAIELRSISRLSSRFWSRLDPLHRATLIQQQHREAQKRRVVPAWPTIGVRPERRQGSVWPKYVEVIPCLRASNFGARSENIGEVACGQQCRFDARSSSALAPVWACAGASSMSATYKKIPATDARANGNHAVLFCPSMNTHERVVPSGKPATKTSACRFVHAKRQKCQRSKARGR